MKSALVVVGKALRHNKPFLNYIYSTIIQHIDIPDQVVYIDKNDKNLFFILEETISHADAIIVVTLDDSFNLINKVLATLGEEVLELKNGMLLPAKTALIQENSYLLERDTKRINVLKVNETDTLPKILIDNTSEVQLFSVIDSDEESLKILLEPLAQNYEIKITPTTLIKGWVIVEAISNKYGNIENFFKATLSLLPKKVIFHTNIFSFIAEHLEKAEKTISFAESCTGGLIASMFTKQSGISSVFNGSVVSYANEVKESWLGVSHETLERFGAVSEECVVEMLEGIMDASLSDFALAISGIAGPNGGSEEKPVGTVFVGARSKEGIMRIEKLSLKGDREYIQEQSMYHALKLLLHVGENIFLKNSKIP